MERLLFAIFISIYCQLVSAYGVKPHEEIAKETLAHPVIGGFNSIHGDTTTLNDYYLTTFGVDIAKPYSYQFTMQNSEQWITQGSQDEDNIEPYNRPVNHFYDPEYDDSLYAGMDRRYLLFPISVAQPVGPISKA